MADLSGRMIGAMQADVKVLTEIEADPNAMPQDPNQGGSGMNQGTLLYKAHGKRFNYAFHDGHVQLLRIEQTYGTGLLTAPRGMWTIAAGD